MMLFVPVTLAQKVSVSGTVVDVDHEPLIGVSVVEVDNITNGMSTDLDGKFTLSVAPNAKLSVSYIGYETKIVEVSGKTQLMITLAEDRKTLDDVVVIGYGTQKKADLTGAVAVVSMKDAKKNSPTNIGEMLQGQVPGVSVATSSEPGSMANVRIRGIGSFSSVGPLYVIDGLIVNDVNHLNPSEIENMQVLKDASAAAIYGARGANGVILITTKKGKKGAPTLDINANWSLAGMPKKIDVMNSIDFLQYNELAYLNSGVAWPAQGWSEDHLGQYIPNTDWQKANFQTGFTQDYNIMYSQGSDNVNMAVGLGWMDQTGIIEGPDYSRFTARVNTDATYKWLKIGENLTYQHTNTMNTNGGSFANVLSMPTVIPVYDPFEPTQRGGFGYGSADFPTYSTNPVANQKSFRSEHWNDRIIGNFFAELTLFDHLTYKLNAGLDAWWGRSKNRNNCYTMRMASGETRYQDVLTEDRDSRVTILIENTLTYTQSFGKHNISALVGYTTEDVRWNYLRAEGYNQQVPGLWQIALVGTQNNMYGVENERRMISYLGRVDYNYAERYLLQFNFRSDGCSKFGPENRRGYFPSVSLGWKINEEAFFEPLQSTVNLLKLRASWGTIGDMQALGNYDYIPSIDHSGPYEGLYAVFGPSGNENVHYGATQSARVNVNLGWESKTTTNIGADFEMLGNRLFGSVEWFNSKSTDLLFNIKTAWATGTSTLWTNFGRMTNSGFEATLGWRDHKGDFDYSFSANVTALRNKVNRLGGDDFYDSWHSRTQVGRSIGEFYLIQFDGIFQSMDEVYDHTTTLADGTVKVIQPNAKPGDVRYIDADQDGDIDADDRVFSGSPLPKCELGVTMNLSWKGLDFSMFWAGQFGNKIYNGVRQATLNYNVDNLPTDAIPWTWDHPSTEFPRMYANATSNNIAYCDRFLEDGTFFRMKNIQLGYTLPQAWTSHIFVKRIRAFVSGSNLLTFTKYKGYDPDIICTNVFEQGYDSGQFPSAKQVNFGVQVNF